jgi:hypothetical protein
LGVGADLHRVGTDVVNTVAQRPVGAGGKGAKAAVARDANGVMALLAGKKCA